MQLQPEPARERPGDRREHARRVEHARHDAEGHHKAADGEHRLHGRAHRLRQCLGKADHRDLRALDRDFQPLPRRKEHPHQHRRQDMDAIEQQSGARAVKHTRARRADEKGGAGVVAEGERALGLAARETAVAVKLRDSRRA